MGELALKNCPIDHAILFLSKPELRPVFRKLLKQYGIENISTPNDVETCVVELIKDERALLILDWKQSSDQISILNAAQNSHATNMRPVLMLSSEDSPEIVALGAEYQVSRVLTGDFSFTAIESHIKHIITEEADLFSLRQQLVKVGDAQAISDWGGAEHQLLDLLDDFKNNPLVMAELVNHYIRQEHWDKAFSVSETLYKEHPDDLRSLHLYGRCLMKNGRFPEAIGVFKTANLTNPFKLDRLLFLGRAYLEVDDIKEAKNTFDSVLKVDRKNKEANQGLGQCHLMEGDINEALSLLREFSSSREMASIFNDSAILSIRHKHFQEGLDLYRAGIKALGEESKIVSKLYLNLGIAYHKFKKIELAYESFAKAVEIDPSSEKAKYNKNIYAQRLNAITKNQISADTQDSAAAMEDDAFDFDDSIEDESL